MSLKIVSRRKILQSGAAAVTAATVGATSAIAQTAGKKQGIRTIVSEGLGRIVILSFDRGEKLREGIRDKMAELGIKNAVIVSAIGTFEKARFHRIKNVNQYPEDEIIVIEDAMELSSVDGIIADGEPHFHMTFQDTDRAYSAHLEDGSIVCYLAEIVLAEIKGVELTRVRNEYGIALLQEKE